MRLIINFADGSVKPAFAAYVDAHRLRAFVPGCDDVVEFTMSPDGWLDEEGRLTAIRFGVADAEFHSLVWNAAQKCDSQSDALQIHLLSLLRPAVTPCERLN